MWLADTADPAVDGPLLPLSPEPLGAVGPVVPKAGVYVVIEDPVASALLVSLLLWLTGLFGP